MIEHNENVKKENSPPIYNLKNLKEEEYNCYRDIIIDIENCAIEELFINSRFYNENFTILGGYITNLISSNFEIQHINIKNIIFKNCKYKLPSDEFLKYSENDAEYANFLEM